MQQAQHAPPVFRRRPASMRSATFMDGPTCWLTWSNALTKICTDGRSSTPVEVYLGDYIDRGSDSKAVIDILCHRLVHRNAICLRGNHEALLEAFLQDPEVVHGWIRLGAASTFASYGVAISSSAHNWCRRNFIARSATCSRARTAVPAVPAQSSSCGDYLFVHAGIRPGVPMQHQVQDDLIWIRDEFLQSTADHGCIVVHGHTPVQHPQI